MEGLPALHLAVVLLAFCCVIHAPNAETSFPPALRVLQETDAAPSSNGAGDQAVHTGRMELELDDYPGSGANDRHSPWGQERRN